MHGRPTTQSLGDTHANHPSRWRILGVLVLALLVTSIDHTIDRFPNLTDTDRELLTNNVGAAIQTSRQLGAHGDQIATAARTAFIDLMSTSLWIAAGLALCAAIVALHPTPPPGGAEHRTPPRSPIWPPPSGRHA